MLQRNYVRVQRDRDSCVLTQLRAIGDLTGNDAYVTEVFITKSGGKYHATYSCPSFRDVEAERGHEIRRWAAPLKGLSQQPCAVCWPETADYDGWVRLSHRVERDGDSIYEAKFVGAVLRHVPGLRPEDVATQQHAKGKSGSSYFIDFVLRPPGGNQLAIELDGSDKAPGLKSPSQVLEEVETRRADLIASGWRVLNFTNSRAATRPDECVTEIRAALRDPVRARNPSAEGMSYVQTVDPTQPSGPATKRVSVGKLARFGLGVALLILGAILTLSLLGDGDDPSGPVEPVGESCPDSAPVKGNVTDDGQLIFHEPGWRYYDSTQPEECFENSEDAKEDGYRESGVQ